MFRRLTVVLPRIVLGLACILQSYLVISEYGVKWISRIKEAGPVVSQQRSAYFLLGPAGAQYMAFLEQTVPEDYAVVLPEVPGSFGEQNILQFFLLPRGIPACRCDISETRGLSETCRQCLLKEGHAVPVIGGFPPSEVMQGQKRLVPFEGEDPFQGVYLPMALPTGENRLPPDPQQPLLRILLLELGPYFLLFLLGSLAIGTIRTDPQWGDLLALGLPIGIGLETFTVFLAGWIGLSITPATYCAAFLVLIGSAMLIRRSTAGRISPFPASLFEDLARRVRRARKRDLMLVGIAFLPLLLSITISVGRAYSTFDGIANWALKGYAIAYERSIFAGEKWGGHGLAYPQNLALLIGMFKSFSGDVLPGSKLIPSLLLMALMLGCYVTWRRAGVERILALAGSVAIATIPAIFIYSTLGFANLPFTAYLALGTLWSVQGLVNRDSRGLSLGCLMLGFAAWTRPEGAGFGLLILIALVACNWILNHETISHAAALLPYPVIAGLWLPFGFRHMRGDEIGALIERFFGSIRQGDILLAPVLEILRYYWGILWRWHTWGVLAAWLPALVGLGIGRLDAERKAVAWMTGAAGFVAAMIPFGMFTIAAYSPGYGELFLDVSFDRALFPAAILLIWTGVLTAAPSAESGSRSWSLRGGGRAGISASI